MADLVGAVSDDLLGINEESEKAGHVQMVKFRGKAKAIKKW